MGFYSFGHEWPKSVTPKMIERLLGVEGETVQNILNEIVGDPSDQRYDPSVELGGSGGRKRRRERAGQ